MEEKRNQALYRRKRRVRVKLARVSERLRLSVFRSNKAIYGQIIDDHQEKTLVAVSERELGEQRQGKTKVERSRLTGELLAKRALGKKIKQVKFDRGAYKYHGRVKAFAEATRKAGIEF